MLCRFRRLHVLTKSIKRPVPSRKAAPVSGGSDKATCCLSKTLSVDYEPAESRSRLFGGNSNWRGPIWFPMNFLIIESLQKFHHYYGDDFKVEYPTGSGR